AVWEVGQRAEGCRAVAVPAEGAERGIAAHDTVAIDACGLAVDAEVGRQCFGRPEGGLDGSARVIDVASDDARVVDGGAHREPDAGSRVALRRAGRPGCEASEEQERENRRGEP